VAITTKIVSSNHVHAEVYSIQHYVIKFVSNLRQVGVFSGYSGFLHDNISNFTCAEYVSNQLSSQKCDDLKFSNYNIMSY
jgi:hypothetical protein